MKFLALCVLGIKWSFVFFLKMWLLHVEVVNAELLKHYNELSIILANPLIQNWVSSEQYAYKSAFIHALYFLITSTTLHFFKSLVNLASLALFSLIELNCFAPHHHQLGQSHSQKLIYLLRDIAAVCVIWCHYK